MAIEIKTLSQLNSESLQELARQAVVTNITPGARARSMHEIVNRRIARAYDTVQFNHSMGFVPTSSGYFLDLLGVPAGIDRRSASLAVIHREDQNLKFYVTSGLLRDHLPGKLIPAGTTVQNQDGTVAYTIVEDEPFDDVATEVYVAAVAQGAGADYRVGRNILTVHSLGTGILCTNEAEVVSGDDTENDDNYRFRIANSRQVKDSANLAAVRLAMLAVPGVTDVILREYAGYVEALVLPQGNFISTTTLRACAFLADQEKATGIRLVTRGPTNVPFEIYVQVRPTKETRPSEYGVVRRRVKQAILDYFDDIVLGSTMVVQQLEARIQNADERIFDHKVVCFNARRRPQLIRNFQLRDDELFVPDPDSQNPVLVAIA